MSNFFSQSIGYLALESGQVYTGYHFGCKGMQSGELVFNTSMTGYQEILTDPSYARQIVTMTYPEIGNYGCCDKFAESSKVMASGLVIKNLSTEFSNFQAKESLDDYLRKNNVIGLCNVDTRALTRHIRDCGAMRAIISDNSLTKEELVNLAKQSASMVGMDLTGIVSRRQVNHIQSGRYKIAVIDYGIKNSILTNLQKFDFDITVFPSDSTFDEIAKINPDAYVLSNGPGDPASNKSIISEVKKIVATQKPVLAICLGHQLCALALGAKTYKLKFGHRGGNQPVKNLLTNQVLITAHNHGFAVDRDTLPNFLRPSYINLNDNSLEGFMHKDLPVNCVQFHPEASPGPDDALFMFQEFYNVVKLKYS